MAVKNGFYEHHTEACVIEARPPMLFGKNGPYRVYWCKTHGQWCYEQPVERKWVFEDGEVVVRRED